MNKQFFSKYIKYAFVIPGLIFVLAAVWSISDTKSLAQSKTKPIRKAALLEANAASVKFKIGTSELVRQVRKRGVDFRLTAQVESELRAARLRPEVIEAVRDNYRGATTVAATMPRNTGGSTQRVSDMPYNTSSMSNRGRSTSAANTATVQDDEADAESDTDERYEALIGQALTVSYQLFTPGIDQQRGMSLISNARSLATSAIKLDNTRPEGYKIYAFTAFIAQNYSEAEKYCQDVIDRGGSVQFDIYHFHGQQPVKEVLYIDDESVSIEYEGGYNVFKYSEIRSAQTKGMVPYGQGSVAVFSMFFTRGGYSDETFFVPALRGTMQDAQFISKVINNNAAKNR